MSTFLEFHNTAWLSWLFERAAYEDSLSELRYALAKRRERIGLPYDFPQVTVGEFVAAWLGADAAGPSRKP